MDLVLFETLGKINGLMIRDDVISYLGSPSRNLVHKVNWWVNPDQKKVRVGVYIGFKSNMVEAVVYDGGFGRFYYNQKVKR